MIHRRLLDPIIEYEVTSPEASQVALGTRVFGYALEPDTRHAFPCYHFCSMRLRNF
jgi:hypothetical protein